MDWKRVFSYWKALLGGALVLFFLCSMNSIAWCDEQQERSSHEPITFVFENDLFSGKDRGYTNGVILSILGAWHPMEGDLIRQDRFTVFVDGISLLEDLGKQRRRPITFGQMMVTPENIQSDQLVVEDVPYAGMLFGRVNYEYRTARQGEKFGLLLGIVGPSSRAEEVQRIVHKITGSSEPQGWDNQLHDEPAVNIDYEHMWKLYDSSTQSVDGYSADFSSYFGASLGNILTDVDTGVIIRWGFHLSPLPSSVYKGGTASVPDVGNDPQSVWSFFLMAGIELNYTAYTIFLDGNLWEDDTHSVNRVPEQASVFAGFGLAYQRFRLNMFMLRSTEMYTEQDGLGGYGSLTVGWIF